MPDSAGTRTMVNQMKVRIEGGSETRSHTRDKGMSKQVTSTATFGSNRITGSNGDFSAFALNDPLLVENVNLNNGWFTVIGLDGVNGAYLVLDPPPKAEGPISAYCRTA